MLTYALVFYVCTAGWCAMRVADSGMSRADCETVLMLRTTRPMTCIKEVRV